MSYQRQLLLLLSYSAERFNDVYLNTGGLTYVRFLLCLFYALCCSASSADVYPTVTSANFG